MLRSEHGSVFPPLVAVDADVARAKREIFFLRLKVAEAYPQLSAALAGHSRPHREAVRLAALERHAEETAVLYACAHVALAAERKTDIMRAAAERTVVSHLHAADAVPAHQRVGELERAVLHQFGVQTAVGSVVDVFEEHAIHGRGDFSPFLLGVDLYFDVLRSGLCETSGEAEREKQFVSAHKT